MHSRSDTKLSFLKEGYDKSWTKFFLCQNTLTLVLIFDRAILGLYTVDAGRQRAETGGSRQAHGGGGSGRGRWHCQRVSGSHGGWRHLLRRARHSGELLPHISPLALWWVGTVQKLEEEIVIYILSLLGSDKGGLGGAAAS